MKSKLALFDFCGTLVSFQTADKFIHFVREEKGSATMALKEKAREVLVRLQLIRILEKLIKKPLNKKWILWQLKGREFKELDYYAQRYYFEKIKPALIKEVLNKMKELKKKGYDIYIVSGGYDIYLKYFIRDFKLDGLICNKILFQKNRCLGKFDGVDCTGKNKIILLERVFNDKQFLEETISYSDSITDLPLLKWTKKGVVVSKGKSNPWIKHYGLRELIWNR